MAETLTALRIDPAKCTGCKQCELACSWVQTGTFQPSRSLIRVHVFDRSPRKTPLCPALASNRRRKPKTRRDAGARHAAA